MTPKAPVNPERSFGLSVGGVLAVIAAVLLWRGRVVRAEVVGSVGALLVVFGAVYPHALRWPSAIWWSGSRWLGHVNARVFLTLIFGLVLTPLGLLWRAIGRDPLMRDRRHWHGWSDYPVRYSDYPVRYRDRSRYKRMF